MREKTPTDRLRAMLDERGIEYRHQDGTYCSTTTWQSMFGEVMFAEREGLPSTLALPQFIEGVTPEQAIAATLGESRSCAACPEMDNPDSYIFHLMRALEHERGCCRDCKHSHMTSDGKHCKWCSVLATHEIDDEGCCDPPNGYNPEPYFDAGFHCGFFERRVSE